ncbi:MAG: hypothetical protein K2K18_01370, partial [Malacoplasma sp.]|nr:hypothetical protein [Malacoplasma sp.]
MKKKILISFVTVAAAVSAGIAPSVLTKTSVQSSTISGNISQDPNNPGDQKDPNNPGDQKDPNNPGDQKDPNNPNDNPSIKMAYAPETDFFTNEIIYVDPQSNEDLDKFLKNFFAGENLLSRESKYLLNANEYENVEITYGENSANFKEKTFEFIATPVNGAKLDNDKSEQRVVIKLNNLKILSDAETPNSAKITNSVSGKFTSDKDLEDYLIKNFGSLKFAAESGVNFANTTFEYVQNSANLKDKTFKINVLPQENHSWKDGTGRISKEMLVKIPNLTIIPEGGITPVVNTVVRAPIFWTVNSTILSNYKDTTYGWKYTRFFYFFGLDQSQNEWILKTIFDCAIKDYQKLYKVDPVGDYKTAKWEPAFCYSQSWKIFFRANVKPKNGFKWANGSTNAKEVQFSFYVPFTGTYQAGTTTDLSKLSSLIDSNYDSNGLPNQWVSSFGAYSGMPYNDATRNSVASEIRKELIECYWGAYDFSVTDVRTISGSNYAHQTWIYKVKIINKSNGQIIKTIPGYQPY